MSPQIRRVAVVVLGLFAAVFVNLNVVQVLQADAYANNPRNVVRQLEREYDIQRGSILTADGKTEIARSEESGGNLRYQRVYPDATLYGHVTGYYSFLFGRTELEQAQNEVLTGSGDPIGSFADLVSGKEQRGDTIATTIRPAVQAAAREALGDRRGAVVALDPGTGEVLALWSFPTYDPNALAALDGPSVRDAKAALDADPSMPLLNRATRGFYAPGSTFKLVTTAAALEAGVQPGDTFPDPARQDLPQTTATIGNFGGGLCNGGAPITLAEALQVSCNTTFAQLALQIGPEALVAQARAFGFGTDLGGQLPDITPSRIPDAGALDPPSTAQSAIGQRDVRVTPLQMASIAGAIGEGGLLVAPRIVGQVEDFGGGVQRATEPAPIGQPISATTAAALRDMMVSVVQDGTATRAQLPGVSVAGKTGTAESGTPEGNPTVWFTGFAPAQDPTVAVAVVVEDGGDVDSEATGGRVAAPIGRAVLEAALASPSG